MKTITIDGEKHKYNSQEDLRYILQEYRSKYNESIIFADTPKFGDNAIINTPFKVGCGFRVGNNFTAENDFKVDDHFVAVNNFYSDIGFRAGRRFRVGNNFHVDKHFRSGYNFRARSGFKICNHIIIPNNYKYQSRCYYELNSKTWYIQLGCYLRTLGDWEKDFWNNPLEFDEFNLRSAERVELFRLYKYIIKGIKIS